jgi:hypothetical protein
LLIPVETVDLEEKVEKEENHSGEEYEEDFEDDDCLETALERKGME